jgi:hypothetical protein
VVGRREGRITADEKEDGMQNEFCDTSSRKQTRGISTGYSRSETLWSS